jgi:hypothetical protein
MLYKFKSKATGDVIMLEPQGRQILQIMGKDPGLKGIILPLDRAALSVALGRDNVVHLALTDAAAAERVAVPLRRLLHFLGRAQDQGEAALAACQAIDTKDI